MVAALGGGCHDRVIVQNNPVNWVDPTGLLLGGPNASIQMPKPPVIKRPPPKQLQCDLKNKPDIGDIFQWLIFRRLWDILTPPFTVYPPGYGDEGPGTTDPIWGTNRPGA